MDHQVSHAAARLQTSGLLSCEGDDARSFLHAQLTSDVAGLDGAHARRAGWCSAQGRLMATLLVMPRGEGFLLQLSRDLAPRVAKRLALFVLRAKVTVRDVSDEWVQFGLWGAGAAKQLEALGCGVPPDVLGCAAADRCVSVRVAAARFLVLAPATDATRLSAQLQDSGEDAWMLEEIRDGQPRVQLATQEHFVPQMINLERLGGVDFHKGCYPGQEIVARTQYRGALKRRMVRARVAAAAAAGDALFAADVPGQPAGIVANAAAAPEGGSELLAVVQIGSIESGSPVRLRAPDGPSLELLPLPHA